MVQIIRFNLTWPIAGLAVPRRRCDWSWSLGSGKYALSMTTQIDGRCCLRIPFQRQCLSRGSMYRNNCDARQEYTAAPNSQSESSDWDHEGARESHERQVMGMRTERFYMQKQSLRISTAWLSRDLVLGPATVTAIGKETARHTPFEATNRRAASVISNTSDVLLARSNNVPRVDWWRDLNSVTSVAACFYVYAAISAPRPAACTRHVVPESE